MSTHDLKQLKTRIAKAKAENASAKEEVKLAQRKEADTSRLVKELQARIELMEGAKVVLTEHALLRYFQRVLEYDLESIEAQLITNEVRAMLAEMPNGKIPAIGCRLVVKNGVVVTIEK